MKAKALQPKTASDALKRVVQVDRYADLITFKVSWRMLDSKRFHELMEGKPKGVAEIWFEPDDEAFNLAGQISRALKDVGWKVSDPIPMPADRKWTTKPTTILDDLRQEATMNGLAVGCKENLLPDLKGATATGAFLNALSMPMGRFGFAWMGTEYPSLPGNRVIIVMGRHVPFIPSQNPYIPKPAKP